jgi:hypothetical protein
MRLAKWQHPGTGEIRVYVNGLPDYVKVWFTAAKEQGLYDIHTKGPVHTVASPSSGERPETHVARFALADCGLEASDTWEQILNAAK